MARDERISEIFYYLQEHTSLETGRKVGRKVGVVQEIILRKYLEESEVLKQHMYLEQQLHGASGTRHKVEFSWFSRKALRGLQVGDRIDDTEVAISSIDPDRRRVKLLNLVSRRSSWVKVSGSLGSVFRNYFRAREIDLRVINVEHVACDLDVIDRSDVIASLESKRVGAQRFSNSDKLGSGIQTIEKAKQASLVAVELDLRYNQAIKAISSMETMRRFISLIALGNGVHWTINDRQVLDKYIDFTYLVRDDVIIRYFEFIRERAGEEGFLSYFMRYFNGMTVAPPDSFEVEDEDFRVLLPMNETRTLKQVLIDHITRVNP